MCSVEDCDRPAYRRGWCKRHYRRWERHGDPLAGRAYDRPGQPCEVDGCDRPLRSRGLCQTHYKRWQRHADPLAGARVYVASYDAVHKRIAAAYGPADALPCQMCNDAQAVEWAYSHLAPDERSEMHKGRVMFFSMTAEHYFPACKSCHGAYDRAMAEARSVFSPRAA